MTQNKKISAQAAQAREQSRAKDGTFGNQPHDKADGVELSLSPSLEERLAKRRAEVAAAQKATDENPVLRDIHQRRDGTREVTLDQARAYADSIDSDDARLVAELSDLVDEKGDPGMYVDDTGELIGYAATEEGPSYFVHAEAGHIYLEEVGIAGPHHGGVEFSYVGIAPDGDITASGSIAVHDGYDDTTVEFSDVEVYSGGPDATIKDGYREAINFLGSKKEVEEFGDEVLGELADEYELENDPQSYYGVPRADRR